MKVSVSTYSFSQMMNRGELTQIECIGKAKDLGFDAVEIESIRPHEGSTEEEYAYKLAEEAKKIEIPLSNFTFGADFLHGCEGDFEKEIERIKKLVDLAAILGVPSIRHDATRGYDSKERNQRGFEEILPLLIKGCREITEYASTKGIRTTVENHGFFCQDSIRVESLVRGVAHPNFGLLVDMGNFLCVDEDPIEAVSRVAPYAYYAHAKDFHIKSGMGPNPGSGFFKSRGGNYIRGAIVGHGNVPVMQCLSILKQAGYDGYVAIEFEGMEHPLVGLQAGLQNMRNYIDMIS